MENNKISYQTLVERLKNSSPVLENPEDLTRIVIEKVEKISANNLKNKILYLTGVISGLAAALLFCLLIHATIPSPANHLMEPETHTALSGPITPGVYPEKTDIAVIIREKIETNNRKEQLYSFLQKE
ncbi:hypothetical protein FACS189423_09390 [Bacteroidia bacterium]|nr:hypothetical protein FACS189423_09390 [Bacteroidia bacterium]